MRATVLYGAGDVRVETLPDPMVRTPSDAIVRVLCAAGCGCDLHPYRSMPAAERGVPMGREFLGVVEEVGSDVSTLTRGDLVIALLRPRPPRRGHHFFDAPSPSAGSAERRSPPHARHSSA